MTRWVPEGLTRRIPPEARGWLGRGLRYAAALALLAAVLSFLLFALDSLAKRYEGPSVRRPWDQHDARTGTTVARAALAPPWLTWNYYATFWKHRLAGDIDYSIIVSPSQFMRTFGTLIKEGDRRRANTWLLLTASWTLALIAGTALGWVLRAWRGRMRWRTAFASLEVLSHLPLVTLTLLTLLLMVHGAGVRPDWRRLESAGWFPVWDILIFPAAVLAIPLLPRVARFWLDLNGSGRRERPLRWGLRQAREALRAGADAALLALAWVAVVEFAFLYPGLAEWAVRSISDARVAQAWLLFAGTLGFLAVALGGRAEFFAKAAAPGAGEAPSAAAPAGALDAPPRGWFRHLAQHDGLVIGAYSLLAVAGVLLFAGFFPGMTMEDVKALQPHRAASVLYPLGTDVVGRNVWRLLIEGGRVYLPVAAACALGALALAGGLGALAGRARALAAPLRGLAALLSVYPGVWWTMAAVLVFGRGLWVMALGLFLACLSAALAALASPPGPRDARARPRPRGAARAVWWLGLGLVATAQAFLILAHLAFLSLGERYPGPEWGATLRDMFARPHPEWVLVIAPALAVLAVTLALFIPGRIMLDQVERRGWASDSGAKTSG